MLLISVRLQIRGSRKFKALSNRKWEIVAQAFVAK
jgi:hypothetical protein